jgi:hypothetical protein
MDAAMKKALHKIREQPLTDRDRVTAGLLEKELGYSRQYIVRLLTRLMAQGEIHR